MIPGAKESMTPADEACAAFPGTLRRESFPCPYRHVSFSHLGYAIIPMRTLWMKLFRAEREDLRACRREQAMSFETILTFLGKDL